MSVSGTAKLRLVNTGEATTGLCRPTAPRVAPLLLRTAFLSVALSCVFLAGCGSGASQSQHLGEVTTGGDPKRGAAAIHSYGCGSCHTIAGISGAIGLAGPPLTGIGSRIYIAGVLPNTPVNMIQWIRNPKAVDEKTVMPNLGVTPKDAADIGAYLYTLK